MANFQVGTRHKPASAALQVGARFAPALRHPKPQLFVAPPTTPPGPGSIVWTGKVPRADTTVIPTSGPFSTDFSFDFGRGNPFSTDSSPDFGAAPEQDILATGFPPLVASGGQPIIPGAGSISATGIAPRVDRAAAPAAGSIVETGQAPDARSALTPGAGTATATGIAPRADAAVAPGVGSAVATGGVPAAGQAASPGVGSVTVTGLAPLVERAAFPAPGAIAITGLVPIFGAEVLPAPPPGAINFTGFSVRMSLEVLPAAGSVTATGVIPPVSLGQNPTADLIALLQGLGISLPISLTDLRRIVRKSKTSGLSVPVPMNLEDLAKLILSAPDALPPTEHHVWRDQHEVDYSEERPPGPPLDRFPGSGAVAFHGQSPRVDRNALAGLGSVVLTGSTPGILFRDPSTILFTGFSPIINRAALPGVGTISILGKLPSGDVALAPGAGHITLTGVAPRLDLAAVPASGHITASGIAPVVDRAAAPGAGSVVATGVAPSVNATVAPISGSGIATGFPPVITLGVFAPVQGSGVFTGLAPRLDATVSPAVGSLVATGQAPTAIDVVVAPNAGSIIATGFAPTVTLLTNLAVAPARGSVVATGLVPRIDRDVLPGIGFITITGRVPSLNLGSSLPGDPTGVQAFRVADMMERFGFNLFPAADPVATGTTRAWWSNPGGDGSLLTLPMQTGMNALWVRSGAAVNSARLGGGSIGIGHQGVANTFSTPWYRGFSGDPDVQLINENGTNNIVVKVPVGATAENSPGGDGTPGGESAISGVDTTRPYVVWLVSSSGSTLCKVNGSISGAIHSGAGNTIQGVVLVEDGTGPLVMDAVTNMALPVDNQITSIQDFDMTALRNDPDYFPQHLITCYVDTNQDAGGHLWPLTAEDNAGTGSLVEGTLLGIPADVTMPTNLTAGGKFLWRNAQQFGWMHYNIAGAGTLTIKAWVIDPANNAIANDLAASMQQVVPHLCVYTGQTSINNMKGMVNGVRSDAFPAPPVIDYSPTGGVPVAPSSFGAWTRNGTSFYNTKWPQIQPSGGGTGQIDNTFGSLPANYTNDSVVAAYSFITGSSGLTMLSRAPNFRNLTLIQNYCPRFTAATGSKWCMEVRGVVADAIPDVVTLAGQSHNGTNTSSVAPRWMAFSEGFQEPNGAGAETATVTADGDVARFNGLNGFPEILRMSASITFGLPTPDTFISNFLNGSNLARTNASVTAWNIHYYPTQNPDFNDGGTRGHEFNDVLVGINTGYGSTRPQFISEWHPTLFSNTNPNHGVAGWDINLPAWVAGNYTLNQRFTTGGNVYQTTVAGGSTVAPTGTLPDFNSNGIGATGITWSPTDKSANITLSGSNFIATTSNTAQAGVRSTTAKSTGKVYYEFTPNATASGMRMGIANATWNETAATGLGGDNNSLSSGPTGIYRLNNVASAAHNSWVAGTPVRVAIDIPNKLLWTAVGNGPWSGATGGGGPATVNNVVSSISVPWDIKFLPDGSFLVTERDASVIRHCTAAGASLGSFTIPNTVTTGSPPGAQAEGGLMGLAIDPNFATNNFIYVCHTRSYNGSTHTAGGNEVIRYTLNATTNPPTISAGLILTTYGSGAFHDGGGLGISPFDGKLYVTTGNGTSPDDTSQVLSGANINDGKILRLNLDGTRPSDNPFNTDGTKAVAGDNKTRSFVWTWGHRNPQGICWDAFGNCWGSEQGPTGENFGSFSGISANDKINLITKGTNYGFPLCYGPNTAVDHFNVTTTPPVITSGDTTVWAPNGIVYSNGNIFFCGLRGAALFQFSINTIGGRTTGLTTRINDSTRKRAATIAPNGLLYYSTTDDDGRGSGAAGQVNSIDLSSFTGGTASDPVSGVGGFSFSGMAAGPYKVAFGDTGASGNAVTVNLGVSAFAQGLPSGFKPWAADDAHFKWQSKIDAYDSYLTAIYILDAFQKGYLGYLWYALYDFGTTFRTGLWATDARTDPTRGPAYVLRAMFQLLGDTGPTKRTFAPTHIDYTVTGLPPPTGSQNDGGHTTLLQRSDGRFALYIWNSQQAPVGISPFTVTVTFNQNVAASVSHYDITTDPVNNMTPVDTHTNVSSVSFQMASAVHCLIIDMGSFGAQTEVISGVTIPTNVVAGTPFNVSGNISGATVPPTLEYQDSLNGVASGSFSPVSGSVTTSSLSFTHPGVSTGTTKFWQAPGRDGGFWRGVLQTTAKWITAGPLITTLRQGTPSIRTDGGIFVIGGAPNPITGLNDPLVTITETSTGHTKSVHIPVGTTTDGFFGGIDASGPYVEWNAFVSTINTTSIQASGSTVSCSILLVADATGPIMEDAVTGQPPHDDAIGQMPEFELLAAVADPNYYIPHKVIYALDPRQFSNTLIWPLNLGDTSAGGNIPQGYTIGIPSGTVRPTGKTRGYYLLFDTLYAHGAFYYNSSNTNAIQLATHPTSTATQALVTDMNAQFPAIMQLVCILSADGTAGSQFNAATVGGIVNGVQSPVVPQPPPLDYSPTNGNAVLPSTFGAWYPSGYDVPSSPVSGGGGGSTVAVTVRDANFPTVTATSNTANVGGLAAFPLTGQIILTGGSNVVPTAQAWSVAHSNAHVTHTGALIVSTTTNNIDQPCYATDAVATPIGKYYWEVVANGTVTPSVGIGTTASAITDGAFVGNAVSSLGWLPDGSIYAGNANIEWIRPGVGSFKDGSGNVFTIVANSGVDAPGIWTMNGVAVSGGGGTGAGTFSGGQVLAQDGNSGTWFVFTAPSTFTATTAPPATTAFGVPFGPGSVRLCIALDMVNLKVWMRVGAAGPWNGAAIGSQNPASNLGGIPLPAGIRTNVVPAVNLRLTNDTATGVFGSGSWAGVPPAGFGQIN